MIYAVGRRDLPPGLRVAQVGHALMGLGTLDVVVNQTLVVVEVPDEFDLLDIFNVFDVDSSKMYAWHEPDREYELTAVAVYRDREHPLLSRLPLMFEVRDKELLL